VPEGQLGSFIAVDDALVRTTTTVVTARTQHGRAACGAYAHARVAHGDRG
jgi:hypothetical protein